jgi:hypothetical protein
MNSQDERERKLEELVKGIWYSFPDGSGLIVTPDVDARFLDRERGPDMWRENGGVKYKTTEMGNPAVSYHRMVLEGSNDPNHKEVARLFEELCSEYARLLKD